MRKIFTIFFVCVCVLFCSNDVKSQNNLESVKAQMYLEQKGEVYFTFTISSRNELFTLTQIISIDNVRGNQVFAYANANELSSFVSLGYTYTVLPHPGDVTEGIEMHSPEKGIWQFDTYPTYSEYETMMATFASTYPDLCKIIQIGTTVNGRKLLFAKISDNVNIREAEPRFMYTSSIHGDEVTGYILSLRLINHLLSNYGSNPEVTDIVNNMEIWINPLANPDGTYKTGDNSVSGAVRYNANNIDMNRNFPDPRAGQHPDGSVWQPETIAMMGLQDSLHFVGAANFHGGAEVVNFPFDTWTTAQKTHADDNWWRLISKEYVDSTRLINPSYMTDTYASGYTEGGDWYVITGGRQDYFNYFRLNREVTLEVSTIKLLPSTSLNNYWNYNYRSMINYLKESMYGFRGIVTDFCTGEPLVAKVFVNNHDRDSSHVYSEATLGDYYRPIIAGTYSVTYSAPGYVPQTFTITTANKQFVTRNVQLVPAGVGADFSNDVTSTCSGVVNFTCNTPIASAWQWDFGDGNFSTDQNPIHTYTQDGIYTVKLTVTNSCTNQLEKTDLISVTLVSAPTVTSASRCGTGSVNLLASGSGLLQWFDAEFGGNLLATNDTFITSSLSQTTTYYVESASNPPSQYVGVVSSTTNGTLYNQNTLAWINFDCLTDINLVSVEVNAGSSGNREISLYNNTGTKIDSVILNIAAGVSRINLNFHIPAGTGYRLTGSVNANMYRSQTGFTYPILLADMVNMTSSGITSTPVLTTRYYYFYNWEVKEIGCSSARVPVTATISAGPSGGTSEALMTSMCEGNSTTISLTGNSGTSIQWQQSPDGTNSWINVVGGSGATTATYNTPVLSSTVFYRAVVSEPGCSDSFSSVTSVTVNSLPVINAVFSDITCFGAANGTVTANVTNGQSPYIFSWSNGASDSELLNLEGGVYSVLVTDAALCTATASVTVNEPVQIEIYSNITDATCGNANGSASVTSSGGIGSVGFQWSNDTTGPNITNVIAGTYFVTATDANGCESSISVAIDNLAQFNANIYATSLECNGDSTASANAVVTGGATPILYSWSTGATTDVVSGLGAGLVSVTITDNNNCSTILSETIVQPNAISASFNTVSTTCGLNNGSIEIIASGGTGTLSYSWSNDSVFASMSNLATGLYDVTVTDGNNCTSVFSGSVNAIPVVDGSIVTQSVSCNGGTNGTAIVNVISGTPPYSYIWSVGDTINNVSSLSAGSISVTITDGNGCSVIVSNTVAEPLPITVEMTITPESLAGNNDGSAIALVTGGTAPYNYSWSNGTHANMISNVPGGTYSLAIIDAHGCFFTLPVVIDVLISIAEINLSGEFKLFPNPAKTAIEVSSTKTIRKIELLSVSGKTLCVYNENVLNKMIDLSSYASGIYFVRITLETGANEIQKLVIFK